MSFPHADSPLQVRVAESLAAEAVASGRLEREPAERLAGHLREEGVREAVLAAAHESKLRRWGDVVTVSRNIFIPLTNLCRDRCSYCTFAKLPESPEARTYTVSEVAEVVRGGVLTGCIEALMCLGDKPEVAYKSHREWLASRGYGSTTDHLLEACQVAFEGGMLPHTNAGILDEEELAALRPWNASMGLMLESTSSRLRDKGMPHQYCPDKDPQLRIRMHEHAGEQKIPFTSGMLLGIGENDAERVDTLLVIRDLQDRFGHIQEAIIQPFHPKPGTRMRAASALRDEEVAGWVALARLILGPDMNVQAPPNLAPEVLELLLRSGLNDWGGVSPVTVDFINPEAPWPALRELRRRTEAAGQRLLERLPVYPETVQQSEFFDPQVWEKLPHFANDAGYARQDERDDPSPERRQRDARRSSSPSEREREPEGRRHPRASAGR
ncbi:MAG: 7,8-didemethyl-8-hydroxy-5-deazariboflavin synthase CofG [Myxococcota bacterium]|nr:7,8-didemethyl-8-hydroxy-5-deazariboflavin synthase CofG [Myxococcota bacterium]